jgi:hypothetical protein
MTDQDLDTSYTALCRALSEVGPDKATVFLAMLCLSLVSHGDGAGRVLALIDQAKAGCLDAGAGPAA